MTISQRDLHQQLRAQSLATRQRLADLVRPLDGSQLNEHPEPNSWSVGQVLEHLCVSDEQYDSAFAAVMRTARPDAGASAREWRPSFLGKLIAGMLDKPRAMKSPKLFQPGATVRNGVIDKLLSRESAFIQAMDGAASLDWRAVRIGSPALPSWAPTMNLGDAFRIHVLHVGRHTRQIERAIVKLRS